MVELSIYNSIWLTRSVVHQYAKLLALFRA
jgi:hypothetical protein